jgi:hypothetical protein
VIAFIGGVSLSSLAAADTLKVIADAELRENGTTGIGDATDTGSGTGASLNARWNFTTAPTNRNEWIALKFDLSAYTNKAILENVALRTTMFRTNTNNSKNLRLYALTPGTIGENWDEATITYGSMPGFTFDANSTTNILDVGGALQSLGTFGVSGFTAEGNVAEIDPASLTTFVKNMGSNNLLTLLISTQDSTTGQWRIASREATATETSVLTGPAGTFAPYLEFDVVSNGLKGDYNNDGVIDAVDYTVWRNKLGTPGLMNEEVSPGETDIADYLYWRLRYGATDPGGAGGVQGLAAVPEPSAAAMVLIAMFVAAILRR